jgi:hypothetical protein
LTSGYPGLWFCPQSPTEAEAETLQPADPRGSHADTVSVALLRGRQELQQSGDLEHLHQGARHRQRERQYWTGTRCKFFLHVLFVLPSMPYVFYLREYSKHFFGKAVQIHVILWAFRDLNTTPLVTLVDANCWAAWTPDTKGSCVVVKV